MKSARKIVITGVTSPPTPGLHSSAKDGSRSCGNTLTLSSVRLKLFSDVAAVNEKIEKI